MDVKTVSEVITLTTEYLHRDDDLCCFKPLAEDDILSNNNNERFEEIFDEENTILFSNVAVKLQIF